MSEFTASNGHRVREHSRTPGGLHLPIGNLIVGSSNTVALREFFQHGRDQELGRWRWPENPDYVVYPRADGYVRVIREVDATSETFLRQDTVDPSTFIPLMVARAYFDAHPEPKPWHNAKPGEVWALTTENVGDEVAVRVIAFRSATAFVYVSGHTNFPVTDPRIESARLVWPEPKEKP